MLEKIKEFQVYASAGLVLIGGAFYIFQILTSVEATAAEYKKLQGQFMEFQRSYQTDRRDQELRRHRMDLKINRIETILERLDRRVAPARPGQ
jgi:hypothetical protein